MWAAQSEWDLLRRRGRVGLPAIWEEARREAARLDSALDFNALDADGDGLLSPSELRNAPSAQPRRGLAERPRVMQLAAALARR